MAAARGCPPAGSGDRGLAELLLEFSRTQYRAKDGGGAAAAKVERIERRCLELFGRDYRYSVISNAHGEVCAHYPRHIVLLERDNAAGRDPFESTVQVGKLQDLINRSKMARCRGRFVCPVILYKGKHICRSATLAGWGELYGRTGYNYIFSGGSDDAWADAEDISEDDSALRNADSQLFDKVRGHDIKLLRYLSVRYICDLMVENKKVKFGLNVTSSEKVDKAQRYADFTLLSIPYPGCEFFKEYKDRDYTAEGLIFNWKQDYVDAPLSIPASVTQSLSIDWSEYQSWDLVQQTQNYLKLLISIINSDGKVNSFLPAVQLEQLLSPEDQLIVQLWISSQHQRVPSWKASLLSLQKRTMVLTSQGSSFLLKEIFADLLKIPQSWRDVSKLKYFLI